MHRSIWFELLSRTSLLLSLCILAIHGVDSSLFPEPSTFTGRTPNPSSLCVSEFATGRLLTQAHNISRTRSLSTVASNGSHGQTSTITVAPPVTLNALNTIEHLGACLLGNPNYTSTSITTNIVSPENLHLSDECLLWNTSCAGNKTLALDEFFTEGTLAFLQENECFVDPHNASLDCSRNLSQDMISEFSVIKDWMRSPQCLSSSSEFDLMRGQTPLSYMLGNSCCDICQIQARNVDVYYWPDPDANTSCLSIIGTTVNPLLYGATRGVTTPKYAIMGSSITYFGCTVQDPFSGQSYITTARLTSIGTVTIKEPLVNPWSAPPCIEKASAVPSPSISIRARGLHASIRARGHSLVLPPNITQNDGLPASTVVMGAFTFTSPSIYANFHNIIAADFCGIRGSAGAISTTMLALSPGELSTIAGPLYDLLHPATSQFNFADLPCPPQSVMEANWYKPEPGEPYRPLIAVPSKLLEIDPWFGNCTPLWFSAYDPPTALRPATALAPIITAKDPQSPSVVPMPSPTHDSGAEKTAAGNNPAPTPAQGQNSLLPQKTVDPQLGLGQSGSNSDPSDQSGTGEQTSQGADASQPSDAKQPNNAAGDSGNPGPGTHPSLPNDPNQSSNTLGGDSDPAPGTNPSLPNDPKPPNNPMGGSGDDGEVDPSSSPSAPNADPPETTISVGGHGVVAGTSGVQVDGVKVKPEGPPATISGVVAINQGNSIVIAHQIVPIPTPTALVTTISGYAITPLANGVSVDGTVVAPGAAPVAISGTSVSVDSSSHIYLGEISYLLPTASPAPSTTLPNGAVAVPLTNGVSLYGTTLTAGAPAVSILGTAVSLDPSYNLIWGGTAQALPSPTPLPLIGVQVTTVAGQVVQPLSDGISIAGTSLTAGASPIMVFGTRISLGASALVIGTSTVPIALNSLLLKAGQITTIAGEAVQRLPDGISVAGTTLTPGAPPVTVSGTRISLGSFALVVGSSTFSLQAQLPTPFVTTVAGQAITAAPNAVEVAGSTLSPGAPAVTIGGILLSLESAGELVVGSKTIALDGSKLGEWGGLIIGGFGSGGPFPPPGSPFVPGTNATSGLRNGTGSVVQPFEGHTRGLKSYMPGKLSTAVTIAIALLFCVAR